MKSSRSDEVFGALQNTLKYYDKTIHLGEKLTKNTRK